MDNKLDKKYQYGWYGSCESECTSKQFDDLQDRKYIESIVRVSLTDGKSFEKFTAYDPERLSWVSDVEARGETFDDYINPEFKQLECGMGYLVIRNSDNLDKVPTIDGFTVADFDGTSGGFVAINGCPDPTPTPTPKAPYINIVSAVIDYGYEGAFGEVEITLVVSLADSTKWQYTTDNNWKVISENSNGNAQTEWKFVLNPGNYVIKVHALDDEGKLGKASFSQDSRTLVVDAPTPTPTPTPTQTPTPTITPTPTPTPINCECSPEGYETATIESTGHSEGDHTYIEFPLNSVVGHDPAELGGGAFANIDLKLPGQTAVVGTVMLSGATPSASGTTFYLKHGITSKCYSGVANSSNNMGAGTWVVSLTEVTLPPECEPTPTPIPEDCCHGMTEQHNISSTITDINFVSAEVLDVSGTLCWNTFTTTDQFGGKNYTVTLGVDNFSNGGLSLDVQGGMDSSNNLFRFTSSNGECWEGRLVNTDTNNVFQKVN